MKLLVNRWLRGLLLTGLYAIGVIGILASGGGDGDGVSGDFTCALIVRGIVPLSNGQVWVGVLAKTSDGNVDSVVLFNSDGSEQLRYEIGDGGTDNAILSIALSRDGNNYLYVGGSFSGGILRLKDDGTLDDGFDVGTGFDNTVTSIAPLADGYVYVGGLFTEFDNDPVSGLVRLDDTGSRDTDFIAIIPNGVTSVALADDGTDHVYSGAFIVPVLERWEANGGAEPVFSSSIGNNEVTSLAPVPLPLPLNDIYVGGIFTNGLIRLNRDGTADQDFDVGSGFDGSVLSIQRQVLGNVYVGGSFTSYDGFTSSGIVRLSNKGTRDVNFIVGDGFSGPIDSQALGKVISVALTTDGSLDVYAGGPFTAYDGSASNGIARLDVDGSLDAGFTPEISFGDETCSNQTIPD